MAEKAVQAEQSIKKENKMGTMPVNKLLLSMALPMIVSMLVQALYNICLLYTSMQTYLMQKKMETIN